MCAGAVYRADLPVRAALAVLEFSCDIRLDDRKDSALSSVGSALAVRRRDSVIEWLPAADDIFRTDGDPLSRAAMLVLVDPPCESVPFLQIISACGAGV